MTTEQSPGKSEPQRLAYMIEEAAQVAGLTRTGVYQMLRDGTLRAVKSGRRTLILADELDRALRALPEANLLRRAA